MKPVMSYTYIWNGVFDNRGRYWKATIHSDDGFTYPPPPGLSSSNQRLYYKFFDLSSEAIDSVSLGEYSVRSYTYEDSNGIWQFLPIRFEADERVVVNPSGGFWHVNTAAYRIARTGEGGDTLVVIEAGLPVLPVTDEDRAAYIEEWVGYRGSEVRGDAEEVAALIPDIKPIIEGVFVDDEGRLWVQRVVPSDAPAFYDRYSEDGDYLGSVRFAFKSARNVFWVQHGNVYSWVVDDLDVPYIVRAPI